MTKISQDSASIEDIKIVEKMAAEVLSLAERTGGRETANDLFVSLLTGNMFVRLVGETAFDGDVRRASLALKEALIKIARGVGMEDVANAAIEGNEQMLRVIQEGKELAKKRKKDV